ncbi:MAG: hypothetical protein H7Y33_17790 [Cytophagales bacterium]|nr:hypothetical protein [Rhizobacter sp.]
MLRASKRLLAAAVVLSFTALCHAAPEPPSELDHGDAPDTRYVTSWVLATADNQGRPFAIVDKRSARISVFEADGRLIGSSAALLGVDAGDFSVPDITHRAPASLSAGERTTPAGRFPTQPGHNDKGEEIVWFDYGASLAIHRLRPAPLQERRSQRLDSPTSADNRISLGCVVVPVAFYVSVVQPNLGRQRGVVYVLPESIPVQAMFGTMAVSMAPPSAARYQSK